MQTLLVRYIVPEGAAPREDRVVVGLSDVVHAKRELFDKPYADDEYATLFHAWLASRRLGLTDMEFDSWLETVAEVEVILTAKQIDESLAAGRINEAIAELWRRDLAAQEKGPGKKARGKSAAPPA